MEPVRLNQTGFSIIPVLSAGDQGIVAAVKQEQLALSGFNGPDIVQFEFVFGEDLRNLVPETFCGVPGKAPTLGLRIVLSYLQFPLP